MRNARVWSVGVIIAVGFWAGRPAGAVPVDFVLDPLRSTFQLGGTFNGDALGPQMAGSDVTGYVGTLRVDVNRAAGTLSIVTNAPRALDQPVDQQPLAQSEQGANYGLTRVGTLPVFLAARGMDLYLQASDAPFNAGSPTFEQVGMFINGGTLYYSTPTLPGGVADLHGYGGGERVVGPLTLLRTGDVETLTIPIRTEFTPYTGEGGDAIRFTLGGQLVATRVVPEPGAAGVVMVAGVGGMLVRTRRGMTRR